jgi:hypothetical protein
MARSERDWRIDLIEAYPDLFHPLPDNPAVAEASPECGAGWRDLLERACARIRAAVQADGGTFKFTQIKEKYATARLDWEGALSLEANTRIEEITDLAWARSACTCEICGAEGCLHRAGGWLMTRCAAHAQGLPVPETPRWENVYDPERYTCPICDSINVQFAIGIEELDDDDPLIEAMKEDGEENGD